MRRTTASILFLTCLVIPVFAGAQGQRAKSPTATVPNQYGEAQSFHQRQRMHLSERKAAAKRLKGRYQVAREQFTARQVSTHGHVNHGAHGGIQ
jgi:hypothetical protein